MFEVVRNLSLRSDLTADERQEGKMCSLWQYLDVELASVALPLKLDPSHVGREDEGSG